MSTMSRVVWSACLAVLASACGGPEGSVEGGATPGTEQAAATQAAFTGSLAVSATTVAVGTPITVTESATNLTNAQVGPIIIGIRRLGFNVVAVQKPRTGICRIAGSATCNFVELAPGETQTYRLTLVPTAAGSFQLQGWTSSSYVTGGSFDTVTVTVH